MTIMRAGRSPRFLGKMEVFAAPVVGALASALGGIRVERGTGSQEPLRRAAEALEGGEAVALMPQGTIPRGEEFFEPVLKGRYGAARLAAMTRAPVIPIGLWGTEKVWPRSERVPRVWNVLRPPRVTVRVGDPVTLGYEDENADIEAIMQAIMDLLPPESREKRAPTEEELRLSKPPS
jgi:putative phosphoserine phosphatase/1-acylglycerol-3-phosphate O-acyltransferase